MLFSLLKGVCCYFSCGRVDDDVFLLEEQMLFFLWKGG